MPLVLQVALGVFLGMLAFHYRKQVAPVLGWLLFLALVAAGGLAYYLFTTPAQRSDHGETVVVGVVLFVLGGFVLWFVETPAGKRANAWLLRRTERWNGLSLWARAGIVLGAFALLLGVFALFMYYEWRQGLFTFNGRIYKP